jgi:serine/threonine protein kinase
MYVLPMHPLPGGTPEYMAPEFILCTGNDHGVDLWSMGILLYEMIQLITPFAIADDNNVQELFKRITRIKVKTTPLVSRPRLLP